MPITKLQKQTCKNIVSIFETGRLPSVAAYSTVTIIPGDTGRLTYGLHQTTLQSGNLYLLIKDYTENTKSNPRLRTILIKYLNNLYLKSHKCDTDLNLHEALREAGRDPVMHEVQEDFFDRMYWDRAATIAKNYNFVLPLTHAVIYDSLIHGSFNYISKKVNQYKNEEKIWVEKYVQTRRDWLLSRGGLLANTTYRMREFEKLIKLKKWELKLPLVVRNVVIDGLTEPDFNINARADEHDEHRRIFILKKPQMTGEDIEKVQKKLDINNTSSIGKYDKLTCEAAKKFQKKHGLKVDGIVGPITYKALGI